MVATYVQSSLDWSKPIMGIYLGAAINKYHLNKDPSLVKAKLLLINYLYMNVRY